MKIYTAHVLISRTCVNNCIFCAVAGERKAQAFPAKGAILDFIQNLAADGTRCLVFSGLGEPTLDPNFEEYLATAADLGFNQICLFTNGHDLSIEKAQRWKKNGLTNVLLSIHGMEGDHDRNVQREGSFLEATSSLQIYTTLGLSVNINTCLTRLNLAEIPRLRKFIAQYPVKMHTLSFPEWSGNVEIFNQYMVDYEEISAIAGQLIPAGDNLTFFDNIPYCIVERKTREMQGMASVRLLDAKGDIELHPAEEKVYPESCKVRGCQLLNNCPGFEKKYIAARGWRDLEELVNRFLDTTKDTVGRGKILASLSVPSKLQTSNFTGCLKTGSYHRGNLLVVVKPTYRCNASCLYCSSHKSPAGSDLTPHMLEKIYVKIFEYAQLMRIRNITFIWHGGEPLLLGKNFYAEAWEKSSGLQSFKVEHHVQTNLLLLDEEWVELLRKFGVPLSTSVDPTGNERAYRDGQLQYPDWVEKFNLACEGDLPVGIVFTATSGHIHQASSVYHFFKNLQFLSSSPVGVRINPVSAVGMATSMLDPKQIIKPAAYGDFLYRLFQLWDLDGRPFVLSPMNEWLHLRGHSCEFSDSCHEHILSIDGTGDVYHCGRFADTDTPLGNILKDRLMDILQNPQRQELRRRAGMLHNGWCKGCPIWECCKGGCPYHAYIHSGNRLHASPFCQGYKLFFEKSGLGNRVTSEEENTNVQLSGKLYGQHSCR